jgi:hypothetical protein
MGKRIYILSWVLLVLQSCATSDALKTTAISERNVDNLARLNLGMTQSQVLGIMRDPYKDESFQLAEDQYDVLFYVVKPTVLSQTRMVPFNLTPLTFKNKILVGTGYSYYSWLKDKLVESQKLNPALQIGYTFNQLPEMLSMCTPKKSEKEVADPPPPPPPPEKKEIEINEEDEQMQQDESDQNFDFW